MIFRKFKNSKRIFGGGKEGFFVPVIAISDGKKVVNIGPGVFTKGSLMAARKRAAAGKYEDYPEWPFEESHKEPLWARAWNKIKKLFGRSREEKVLECDFNRQATVANPRSGTGKSPSGNEAEIVSVDNVKVTEISVNEHGVVKETPVEPTANSAFIDK